MDILTILELIIILGICWGWAALFLSYAYGHLRRYTTWDMISDLGWGLLFVGCGLAFTASGVVGAFLLVVL